MTHEQRRLRSRSGFFFEEQARTVFRACCGRGNGVNCAVLARDGACQSFEIHNRKAGMATALGSFCTFFASPPLSKAGLGGGLYTSGVSLPVSRGCSALLGTSLGRIGNGRGWQSAAMLPYKHTIVERYL
jgi:hypothetical protein